MGDRQPFCCVSLNFSNVDLAVIINRVWLKNILLGIETESVGATSLWKVCLPHHASIINHIALNTINCTHQGARGIPRGILSGGIKFILDLFPKGGEVKQRRGEW